MVAWWEAAERFEQRAIEIQAGQCKYNVLPTYQICHGASGQGKSSLCLWHGGKPGSIEAMKGYHTRGVVKSILEARIKKDYKDSRGARLGTTQQRASVGTTGDNCDNM